jgi:hypothetical protein
VGDVQQWAIQGSNTSSNSPEKPQNAETGTAESAADSGNSNFAATIAAIMSLPLTEVEKAQAVRRLLSQQ